MTFPASPPSPPMSSNDQGPGPRDAADWEVLSVRPPWKKPAAPDVGDDAPPEPTPEAAGQPPDVPLESVQYAPPLESVPEHQLQGHSIQRPTVQLPRQEPPEPGQEDQVDHDATQETTPEVPSFVPPPVYGRLHPKGGKPRGLPGIRQPVPDTILDGADFDGLTVR